MLKSLERIVSLNRFGVNFWRLGYGTCSRRERCNPHLWRKIRYPEKGLVHFWDPKTGSVYWIDFEQWLQITAEPTATKSWGRSSWQPGQFVLCGKKSLRTNSNRMLRVNTSGLDLFYSDNSFLVMRNIHSRVENSRIFFLEVSNREFGALGLRGPRADDGVSTTKKSLFLRCRFFVLLFNNFFSQRTIRSH